MLIQKIRIKYIDLGSSYTRQTGKQKSVIPIILFLMCFVYSQAQNDSITKPVFIKYIDAAYEYGTIIGNGSEGSDQILQIPDYHGFDVRLAFRNRQKNDIYSSIYRKPHMGVGWFTSNFSNKDVGNPNAFYVFMTLPFSYKQDKKLTFSYSAAFGLAYNFFPYDSLNNQHNIFISTNKNCYVHFKFLANYQISDHWSLNASVGFKHASNGAIKLPNAGINLLPYNVGLSYKIGNENLEVEKIEPPAYTPHNLWNFKIATGTKNFEIGDPNYFKATLGANYLRQFSYKYRLGGGIEAFYTESPEKRSNNGSSSFADHWSVAAVGSWEWVITEKIHIPIDIGVYLHRNEHNKEFEPYYERIGVRYRFTQHLFAGLTIKAHNAVADYFEWTIGYTIHKDPNKYKF